MVGGRSSPFEVQIRSASPDLSDAEVQRRAGELRRAYFPSLAAKSSIAPSKRRTPVSRKTDALEVDRADRSTATSSQLHQQPRPHRPRHHQPSHQCPAEEQQAIAHRAAAARGPLQPTASPVAGRGMLRATDGPPLGGTTSRLPRTRGEKVLNQPACW